MNDIFKNCRPCFSPFSLQIPTAFSESYSYADMICKLAEIIKILSDKIDNNDNTLLDYVDSQIAILKNYTDNQINNLDIEFTNQLNVVLDLISKLRDYIDTKSNDTLNKCLETLYKLLGNCDEQKIVINPIYQTPDCLQNVLNDLYNSLRFCLTCIQYDNANLTAAEYDNYKIMAFRFDLYSYFILFDYLWRLYSPFTGKRESHQQVILELAQYMRVNALSASTYDALDLTANIYDDKQINAYDYDWSGTNNGGN